MRYAFSALAFGLTTSAAVLRRDDQCCFQLTASGGQSGTVGQLSDGQNRIGGSYSPATYCLSNGGITDQSGRGCILTAPTTQFQCDSGATATTGFSVGSGGALAYNGNTQFYACPATSSEYNIYTTPVSGQDLCVEISLTASSSCGASSSAASSPSSAAATSQAQTQATSSAVTQPGGPIQSVSSAAASTPETTVHTTLTTTVCMTSEGQSQTQPAASASSAPVESSAAPQPVTTVTSPAAPAAPATSTEAASSPASAASAASSPATASSAAPSASSSTCPEDLNGDYQYPHLIVPVNSSTPTQSYGTSYNGEISSTVCSLYNFDIPQDYAGSTCTVVFLFPTQDELETSSFTVSGSGDVTFSQLPSAVSQTTTWNDVQGQGTTLATTALAPGNSYVVASGSCAAGQTVAYEACGSGSFSLEYFQDYNPSPIGLYVRKC